MSGTKVHCTNSTMDWQGEDDDTKEFTFLHTIVYREIIMIVKNQIWDLVEISDLGPFENLK